MNSAAQIAYTKEYENALISLETADDLETILAETEILIERCPGNYTAWTRRAEILFLDGNLSVFQKELAFIRNFIIENKKIYQAWEHRRKVIENIGNYEEDLQALHMHFLLEPKNHHAWAYRQWLLFHLPSGFFIDELFFTEQLLDIDSRNNSAWAHRFFVLTQIPELKQTEEIVFAFTYILEDLENPSPANYFLGLADIFGKTVLLSYCRTLLAKLNLEQSRTTLLFKIKLLSLLELEEEKHLMIKIFKSIYPRFSTLLECGLL